MDKNENMAHELRGIAAKLRAARLNGGMSADECHDMAHEVEDIADILQYVDNENQLEEE